MDSPSEERSGVSKSKTSSNHFGPCSRSQVLTSWRCATGSGGHVRGMMALPNICLATTSGSAPAWS
jgi:hypothetical protein